MSNGAMLGVAIGSIPAILFIFLFGSTDLTIGFIAGIASVLLGAYIKRAWLKGPNAKASTDR